MLDVKCNNDDYTVYRCERKIYCNDVGFTRNYQHRSKVYFDERSLSFSKLKLC
jgi:hypothetical protein